MINRAKLRGTKLDEDCKIANTTTEADLCVCFVAITAVTMMLMFVDWALRATFGED